ncbi:MAG: hypothetical protein GDA48_03270, partial [Hormoscilla sp. GM102CHS1]|nr:hypothetical protein [Hormoscilla sp. GM102CHS1]
MLERAFRAAVSRDRVVRRCCFHLAAESAGIEKLWLLDRAIADGDIAVRLWGHEKLARNSREIF